MALLFPIRCLVEPAQPPSPSVVFSCMFDLNAGRLDHTANGGITSLSLPGHFSASPQLEIFLHVLSQQRQI